MITPDEVFSLLAVKDGMKSDRYFVGREELLSSLNGCVVGDQHSAVWIYGPRRIGKSSIGEAIARKAKESDTKVITVDTIDLAEEGVFGAMRRVLEKAKNIRPLTKDSIKDEFELLARSSQECPITLIFDEFDKVALSMKMDDQAFFRRLATENDKFCYVFISCLPPGSIVEEVPEINSRILGICNQQRIMPLERRAIYDLCHRVAKDIEQPKIAEMHGLIRKCAGGFPVAVMMSLKKIAVAIYHRDSLTNDDIDEILDSTYEELEIDLKSYWSTLHPGTKSVLIGEAEITEFEQEVKEDGFKNRQEGIIKPSFLIKVGEISDPIKPDLIRNSTNGGDFIIVTEIFQLISQINHSLQLRGEPNGFYIGNRNIEFFHLTRQPCTEDEFKNCIDYMYKLFFEGARERKDGKGEKKYRLPSPLDMMYKKECVVGDISNLRNFLFHDQSRCTDAEKPNKHFKQAGGIFKKRCGNQEPITDNHRQVVKMTILQDMKTLLKKIYSEIQNM